MEDAPRVTPRQIWANPTTSSTKTYSSGCTPFVLPSNGMLRLWTSFYLPDLMSFAALHTNLELRGLL
jgi:hypothetical protein